MRSAAQHKLASNRARRGREGFTLLELSAVILIVSVLVSLLSAALNHTKNKALRIACLDNMKQLQLAWKFYTDDNDDRVALNQTAPAPAHHRIFARRTSTNSWVSGNPLEDRTTANIRNGTLYPYLRSTQVYRCPLDDSTVGKTDIPRTRSYAMSAYIGGDNAEMDPRVKLTAAAISHPANTFVFIEEHQSSKWGANFVVPPQEKIRFSMPTWSSTPSDRHYQGCNLSFADGHVAYWKWFSPKERNLDNHLSSNVRELTDIRKLQSAIPAP